MRDTAKLALRLMIFALVAGLLLAFVNAVTEGPIAANNEKKKNEARTAVIGDYVFEQVDLDLSDWPHLEGVYAAMDGETVVGYVYELTSKGYGGMITLSCGVVDGRVNGVSIATHAETKGLGSSAEAPFLQSFIGMDHTEDVLAVDAMTGATVSSDAVKTALQEAADHYAVFFAGEASEKEGA